MNFLTKSIVGELLCWVGEVADGGEDGGFGRRLKWSCVPICEEPLPRFDGEHS